MVKYLAVYFLYAVISLLFFLQYPLSNSLTGNLDTIANLAMFKHLKMYLDFYFFNGAVPPDFCYPAANTWLLFGADFGSGIIHVFFNYLGFNDLWANYLYYSTIFSLNGFTLFLLIRKILNRGWLAPISASLVFIFSHFTLATLENPNTLIFFPSFLSLYFLIKYMDKSKWSYLCYSFLLGGFLIYLSPTNFVMHIILWVFFVSYFPFTTHYKLKFILFSGAVYLFLVFPLFYFFIFKMYKLNAFNYIDQNHLYKHLSLHINNLFEVLHGHLYLTVSYIPESPFLSKIKSAFLGVTFYSAIILGLILVKKTRRFIILFLIALIISIGPVFMINFNEIVPSIMYPFYEHLNFGNYIRIPIRFFLVSILAGTFVIAYVLDFLKSRNKIFLFWAIFLLILLENVPFKMETYGNNQQKVLNPDKKAFTYLKSKSDIKTLLFLPSDILNYQGDRNEYIYMYWQQFHSKNIVNGNLALFPPERMYAKELTDNFNDECIKRFMELYDVDAFVYAKSLAQNEDEKFFNTLKSSTDILKLTFEDKDFVIFEKHI